MQPQPRRHHVDRQQGYCPPQGDAVPADGTGREDACQGREKIITRNGKAYVALISARRLDYYHRLERENIHLTLLEDVARGWDDVESGDLLSVAELKSRYGRGE